MDRNIFIELHPRKVIQFFFLLTGLLLLANFAVLYIRYGTGNPYFYGLVPLFDFDMEKNIPTLYSVCLFLLNAILFFLLWRSFLSIGESRVIWFFLSILFVFLGIDELSSVHEHLSVAIGKAHVTTGFFHYAWVIPYGIGVIMLAFFVLPAIFRFDRHARILLILSAVIFVSGALGGEMVGGKYLDMNGGQLDVIYGLITTGEELLEMSGLIVLMHALLWIFQSEFGGLTLSLPASEKAPSSARMMPGSHPRKVVVMR